MKKKIVIIGCGAAGGTAAQFARKYDRKAEIVIFDKEGYGQYSRCALPYVIAGKDWKEIVEFPPQWFERHGISYRNEKIYSIDFDAKLVEGSNIEEYDELIIATGSLPNCPFKAENVYFLRSIDDAIQIRKKAMKSKKAIIIGAGLIGMEVAEALIKLGTKVKILEYMPNILPNMLDKDVSDYLMKKLNLDIELSCRVEEANENVVYAEKEYKADFIIVATGNKADVGIAKKCNIDKAIVVDEKCKALPHVYAAGDCTQVIDFFGRSVVVGLGSIATRQGMVAGINSAGGDEKTLPFLFSKTTKLFDIEIASIGLLSNEIDGIEARYIGKDLPHYMNGEEILVKIISDKEGKIVGCQAIGRGAAKIVDRVAIAIYNKMNVKELSRIENAYAPSVAPVFDAVSMACKMIERKIK